MLTEIEWYSLKMFSSRVLNQPDDCLSDLVRAAARPSASLPAGTSGGTPGTGWVAPVTPTSPNPPARANLPRKSIFAAPARV